MLLQDNLISKLTIYLNFIRASKNYVGNGDCIYIQSLKKENLLVQYESKTLIVMQREKFKLQAGAFEVFLEGRRSKSKLHACMSEISSEIRLYYKEVTKYYEFFHLIIDSCAQNMTVQSQSSILHDVLKQDKYNVRTKTML